MNQISFEEIISVENLLLGWKEFLRGKRQRKDVQEFQLHLLDNIVNLHIDLKNKVYIHGLYVAFNINDPKPRNIHKALVRDRLLHHAIYRVLYPYFDTKFIYDLYSCRKWKGTHRAVERFTTFGRKASQNHRKTLWILKCDVRKFFASIDHEVLKKVLTISIQDESILWLLSRVIDSFKTPYSIYAMAEMPKGLPLGNLTSQLLVNVYMDWFDQYMKHRIRAKYYIRYADDFVVMSRDKDELEDVLIQIKFFLGDNLLLELHPDKVFIKTLASGVDFLGWVHFPKHRVLRTTTKRRMYKNLQSNPRTESLASYLGLLSHRNTKKLRDYVQSLYTDSVPDVQDFGTIG